MMKEFWTKKIAGMLLAAALLLSGCGPAETPEPLPPESPAPAEEPQPEEEQKPETPEPVASTLVVCGDVMSHMPVTNDAWDADREVYDYSRIMAAARPYAEAADCAVANLETTLSGGPPYSGFPAFNSPDDLAAGLKETGFDLLLTANNHCLDKGGKGLSRTLDVLDETGLVHVGTSRTQQERDDNIQVMDVGGISVAFLGYTYGTNGIPLPKDMPYAVNLFNKDYLTHLSTPDTEGLLADLEKAKALDTDLVAVMIHWGVEYQTVPNSYQKEIGELLLSNGADLVLGGHPHVLQPMELRTEGQNSAESGGFLCYSLGNFISAQNDPLTDTTVVLTLELTKDPATGTASVTDYDYRPMLMLDREGGPRRYELLDVWKELEREDLSADLEKKLRQAVEDCHQILGEEHDAGRYLPADS